MRRRFGCLGGAIIQMAGGPCKGILPGRRARTASAGRFVAPLPAFDLQSNKGGASGVGLGQAASKFAVRGLTEALRGAHAKYNIGVSSLCPANVNTNIAEATFTRPAALSHTGYRFNDEILTSLRTIYFAGWTPVELAERVMTAIRKNQLYVIPYPEGTCLPAGGFRRRAGGTAARGL